MAGKQIQEGLLLRDFGIQNQTTLDLSIRVRGGACRHTANRPRIHLDKKVEYILIEPRQPQTESARHDSKHPDPLGLSSPNPHMTKLLKNLERVTERIEMIEIKLKTQKAAPAP